MPFTAVALLHVLVRARLASSVVEVRDSARDIVAVLSPTAAVHANQTHTLYHARATLCQRRVLVCPVGTSLRFSRLELRLVDICDGVSMHLDDVRVALGGAGGRVREIEGTAGRAVLVCAPLHTLPPYGFVLHRWPTGLHNALCSVIVENTVAEGVSARFGAGVEAAQAAQIRATPAPPPDSPLRAAVRNERRGDHGVGAGAEAAPPHASPPRAAIQTQTVHNEGRGDHGVRARVDEEDAAVEHDAWDGEEHGPGRALEPDAAFEGDAVRDDVRDGGELRSAQRDTE